MNLQASIPIKNFNLLVTVVEDIYDDFDNLEIVESAYIKDVLRTLSDDDFFINDCMDIYVVISMPYGQDDLYARYGNYLDEMKEFDHYKKEYSLEKKHNIIKEQIYDFKEHYSKLANGDTVEAVVTIEKQPIKMQIVNECLFYHTSSETEFVDSCGSVYVEIYEKDFSNALEVVKEASPDLTEHQIKQIEKQLTDTLYS